MARGAQVGPATGQTLGGPKGSRRLPKPRSYPGSHLQSCGPRQLTVQGQNRGRRGQQSLGDICVSRLPVSLLIPDPSELPSPFT